MSETENSVNTSNPNRRTRRARASQMRGIVEANRKYNQTRTEYVHRLARRKSLAKRVEEQRARSAKRNALRKKIGKEYGVNFTRVILLSKLEKGVPLKYTIR